MCFFSLFKDYCYKSETKEENSPFVGITFPLGWQTYSCYSSLFLAFECLIDRQSCSGMLLKNSGTAVLFKF